MRNCAQRFKRMKAAQRNRQLSQTTQPQTTPPGGFFSPAGCWRGEILAKYLALLLTALFSIAKVHPSQQNAAIGCQVIELRTAGSFTSQPPMLLAPPAGPLSGEIAPTGMGRCSAPPIPRRFPVRRSAVNGMGTPHGADTTETVLHVDAAKRLPDAASPWQQGRKPERVH